MFKIQTFLALSPSLLGFSKIFSFPAIEVAHNYNCLLQICITSGIAAVSSRALPITGHDSAQVFYLLLSKYKFTQQGLPI